LDPTIADKKASDGNHAPVTKGKKMQQTRPGFKPVTRVSSQVFYQLSYPATGD
jgi:hypothetical protein